MTQQPSPATSATSDPELKILLVEEDIIELQGKVVMARNDLAAAQKLREESEPGSASALVAETEIDEICSSIDVHEAKIKTLETERRRLQMQIHHRFSK